VNDLFGDIVKVTPSSKVVGDMALFLFTRGIKPADVVNLEPGSSALSRERARHARRRTRRAMGGWPKDVVKAVPRRHQGETREARAREAP
jgi:pyruvate carboxylase